MVVRSRLPRGCPTTEATTHTSHRAPGNADEREGNTGNGDNWMPAACHPLHPLHALAWRLSLPPRNSSVRCSSGSTSTARPVCTFSTAASSVLGTMHAARIDCSSMHPTPRDQADADQAPFLHPLLFLLAHASGRSITGITSTTLALLWACHGTVHGEQSGGGLQAARSLFGIGGRQSEGQSCKRATFSSSAHRRLFYCWPSSVVRHKVPCRRAVCCRDLGRFPLKA
jgi:hypothetical protein